MAISSTRLKFYPLGVYFDVYIFIKKLCFMKNVNNNLPPEANVDKIQMFIVNKMYIPFIFNSLDSMVLNFWPLHMCVSLL